MTSYYLRVSNKHIYYDLSFKEGLVLLSGEGGSGKTTLINMLCDYARYKEYSGIKIDTNISSLAPVGSLDDWKYVLKGKHNAVVFVDDIFEDLLDDEFLSSLRAIGGNMVFVSRRDLPFKPDDIIALRSEYKRDCVYTQSYRPLSGDI